MAVWSPLALAPNLPSRENRAHLCRGAHQGSSSECARERVTKVLRSTSSWWILGAGRHTIKMELGNGFLSLTGCSPCGQCTFLCREALLRPGWRELSSFPSSCPCSLSPRVKKHLAPRLVALPPGQGHPRHFQLLHHIHMPDSAASCSPQWPSHPVFL